MTMPTFLIIGANKAGTTSLYTYLKQHPQVYMSPVKEPMFFNLEGRPLGQHKPGLGEEIVLKQAVNNVDDYRLLFSGVTNELAIGEASTAYLHVSSPSAERILHYIPHARLIAILRDPVERAFSNYLMYVRWGLERSSDFAQAVALEKERIRANWPNGWHYVAMGFYYERLKHYFDLFDARNQIKIHLYEDWNTDTVGVLKDIFRFLGVDDSFTPDVSVRYAVSQLPRSRMLHSFLTEPTPLYTMVKPILPTALRARVRTWLLKRNYYKPKLPVDLRRTLVDVYREDILKLQDLIDRDLTRWLD